MITKEQALKLKLGDVIYEIGAFNADGTPRRWRVNGNCKTWKRNTEAFKVPLKHGLKAYGYLDEYTNHRLCLGLLKVICCKCRNTMEWKDTERELDNFEGYIESHGICLDCKPAYEKELGL